MEIDPVSTSESKGGRPAEELEEALPFVFRKKVKIPEKIESLLAEELKDLEEALSLASRTGREKLIEVVDWMGPLEIEEALSIGYRRKVERPEEGKAVQETGCGLGGGALPRRPERGDGRGDEEVPPRCCLVQPNGLRCPLSRINRGIKDEGAVSLAKNFLTMYRIVYTALNAELLASFDRVRFDPELCQWEGFGRFVKERKSKGPKAIPFLLFKIKASAKDAKVSWWRKEYDHFPPERQGYTAALRVVRLVVGREGSFCLEEAGQDGQLGALSHGVGSYSWPDPRVCVLKDGWLSQHNEVSVVRRKGISIMSYVNGLGVKLDDFLFVLNMAWTVPLSFAKQSFYVSSKFTEETLYAVPGVDFINITVPVENLMKKLYQIYEHEEQDKKMMLEKQDPQDRQEMMCLQEELGPKLEEQERKKEDLRRRKEHKLQRKKKKEVRLVKEATRIQNEQRKNEQRQNEEFEEDCFMYLESDWVQPLDEEMWQSDERPNEFLEETMKPVEENDLPKLGRGGIRGSKRTEEPLPA